MNFSGKPWKMPAEPEGSTDDIAVYDVGEGHIAITNSPHERLFLSRFTASQLVAMLMMVLDMPVPKGLGKKIMLGRRPRPGDPAREGFTVSLHVGLTPDKKQSEP